MKGGNGASGNFLDLYSMLGDHQGSVTSVLSHNSGQTSLVQQLAYTAFGAIGSIKDGQGNNVTTGPISRFAYTGREFDPETGDYFYRARYYDPQTGRFLSQDPIGFAAGDMNLYRYVGNSSPNFVDPSGLQCSPCVVVNRDHDGKPNPSWCSFAEDLLGKDVPYMRGPLLWHTIPAFLRKSKSCHLIILGHRGNDYSCGITNPGGCTTYRPNDQGKGRRLLPDPMNELDLRETFKSLGCTNCRIDIIACSTEDKEVHNRTLQRIANSTGCTVCGPKESMEMCPRPGKGPIDRPNVINPINYEERLDCFKPNGDKIPDDPARIRRPPPLRG